MDYSAVSIKTHGNRLPPASASTSTTIQPLTTVKTDMQDQSEPQAITLQQLLAHTLEELDISTQVQGERLVLENGLQLVAHDIKGEEQPDGSWRTSTVIEVYHPLIEDVLFEYQHAAGDSQLASLQSGLKSWARMDLATLQDAVNDELEYPFLGIGYTDDKTGAEYQRQVVLGPMSHYQEHTPEPAEPKAHATNDEDDEDDHDFCPCCLFTNSMEAFTEALKGREFVGVRLFASRDSDGEVSADCRINGHDFPEALPYLTAYAQSWPQAGFELRKQYVVIRNKPAE